MFFCYESWQYYGASCSISNQPLYVVIMQSQRTYGKHKVGIGDVFSSKTIACNQTSGLSHARFAEHNRRQPSCHQAVNNNLVSI